MWQEWINENLGGVGCTPWRPLGSASFAWQAWNNIYFAWQVWGNVHYQGIGCTPWRPLGSTFFVWQAWDHVHCQGGRMYALASLGLRLFCVGCSSSWGNFDNYFQHTASNIFFANFAFNGLGSRGHHKICTSSKSLLNMVSDLVMKTEFSFR